MAKKDNTDFNKLVLDIKKQLGFNYKLNNFNNILDKKMNWTQVRKLNQSEYFTVGGHTVNHHILSLRLI